MTVGQDRFKKTIAFPHPPGHGGPGSFQTRFEKALSAANWTVVYAQDRIVPDVVMVVGGTKRLGWLWRMKQAGVPIILRLDGINWLHRKTKKISRRNIILAELRNWITALIRSRLASYIVYQSHFAKQWWESKHKVDIPNSIIWNGVDLDEFHPENNGKTTGEIDVLCLEGNIDYSPYAIELLNMLESAIKARNDVRELVLYGHIYLQSEKEKLNPSINYKGSIGRTELPKAYRNAIYFSLDLNPACPNTVMEALASGLPVVAYNTGALPELVTEYAGVIVEYGGNPWELDTPSLENLLAGIDMIVSNYAYYADSARRLAVSRYDIDDIFNQYLTVLQRCTPLPK